MIRERGEILIFIFFITAAKCSVLYLINIRGKRTLNLFKDFILNKNPPLLSLLLYLFFAGRKTAGECDLSRQLTWKLLKLPTSLCCSSSSWCKVKRKFSMSFMSSLVLKVIKKQKFQDKQSGAFFKKNLCYKVFFYLAIKGTLACDLPVYHYWTTIEFGVHHKRLVEPIMRMWIPHAFPPYWFAAIPQTWYNWTDTPLTYSKQVHNLSPRSVKKCRKEVIILWVKMFMNPSLTLAFLLLHAGCDSQELCAPTLPESPPQCSAQAQTHPYPWIGKEGWAKEHACMPHPLSLCL